MSQYVTTIYITTTIKAKHIRHKTPRYILISSGLIFEATELAEELDLKIYKIMMT